MYIRQHITPTRIAGLALLLLLSFIVFFPDHSRAAMSYEKIGSPGGGVSCNDGDVMVGANVDGSFRYWVYCATGNTLSDPTVSAVGSPYTKRSGSPGGGVLCNGDDVMVGGNYDGTFNVWAYCRSLQSSSGYTPHLGALYQRVQSPGGGSLCKDGDVMVGWDTDGSFRTWSYCKPIISPPPTCSVSFDQNPLTGQSTTMRWSSTGANLFYINNVGYVGASGSAQVFSAGDYSGTVSGVGGIAQCAAMLAGPNNQSQCTPATGQTTATNSSNNSGSAGSQTYSTPGTYTFTVPSYGTLTVSVSGAGGGGGGAGVWTTGSSGGAGGNSSFGSVTGFGGGGGGGGANLLAESSQACSAGQSGGASGGDTDTAGGGAAGGSGGSAGRIAGADGSDSPPIAVSAGCSGGSGGSGIKTYQPGEFAAGTAITVRVGTGGSGGGGGGDGSGGSSGQPGSPGSNGSVSISWTAPSGTTTTVTTTQNSGTAGSVLYTCASDGNLRDSCNNTVTCEYGCSSATNTCNSQQRCVAQNVCNASGTKVLNSCTGATVTDCSASGKICSGGACINPTLGFEAFGATLATGASFTATGHLQAAPSLVRSGATTRLYWNAVNAASCTISGNNGDAWTGLFSGSSGKTSAPITQQTTYILLCRALQGASPATVTESATVNVLPTFQER